MIAHLEGILKKKRPQSVIVSISGVGYEVHAPLSTFYELPEENEPVSLHIHTHVREDALILFGFKTTLEKDLFLMLISVSGIGPKLAINVLSGIGPRELLRAIAGGDAPRLQSIPGVGKKTAERIVLELRDKVGPPAAGPLSRVAGVDEQVVSDAVSALTNLGYKQTDGRKAVEGVLQKLGKQEDFQSLVRESLKLLSGNKR